MEYTIEDTGFSGKVSFQRVNEEFAYPRMEEYSKSGKTRFTGDVRRLTLSSLGEEVEVETLKRPVNEGDRSSDAGRRSVWRAADEVVPWPRCPNFHELQEHGSRGGLSALRSRRQCSACFYVIPQVERSFRCDWEPKCNFELCEACSAAGDKVLRKARVPRDCLLGF